MEILPAPFFSFFHLAHTLSKLVTFNSHFKSLLYYQSNSHNKQIKRSTMQHFHMWTVPMSIAVLVHSDECRMFPRWWHGYETLSLQRCIWRFAY